MNHSTYSVLARYDGSLLTQAKSARDGLIDLRSTIALDQFTGLARSHDPGAFVLAMVPVFGYDLTPEIYFALHTAAVAGELTNPPIEWSADCNYPAEYDDTNRCIVVHVDILNLIIQRPEETWQLLAILLAEFGNHLSNVLRNDIAALFVDATEEQETVGPNQTGWRYATYVAHLPVDHDDTVAIASYSNADGETHSYETPYAKAMENISRFQIYAGDSSTAVAPEGFEASASHHHQYTHESIETNLLSLLSAEEIRSITFGNWLRDYSQLLDPKLVRATDQFVNFPSVLSRQALTAIVDILAVRKFSDVRANKQEAFTVTSEKLGVYRPSEHIDNPKVIDPTPSDPTAVDPDFEPWVQPGDALLQVDFETSMKRYIQRSIAFMQNELEAAIHLGRTDEGLRRLGAALHTLEDYFAHSNFVELSLIKEGHEVLPWTAPTNCKWGLPVVTGMFGSSDVIASLAGPVAEVLAPSIDWRFIPTRPGDRSDAEKMMTILLKESGRTSATAAYLSYLEVRDTLVAIPGSEYVQLYSWATGAPGRLVSDALHSVFRDLITGFGNSIQHAQTLNGSDPNIDSSIDPSHSQLAKDHAEHPLHSLAGSLASIAIREVTKAMRLRWWNEPDAPDPIALATSFITHPQDSEWQGVLVKRWAAQNPHNIHRATLKTELDQIGEALETAASRGFRKFTSNALATYEYLTEHFGIFFGTAGLLSSGKAQLPANTCCEKQ